MQLHPSKPPPPSERCTAGAVPQVRMRAQHHCWQCLEATSREAKRAAFAWLCGLAYMRNYS